MPEKANESETEETQSKREKLVDLIKKIAIKKPEKVIVVPEDLRGFGINVRKYVNLTPHLLKINLTCPVFLKTAGK
jgi:hypothetical protein